MERGVDALKRWTETSLTSIVYDSRVDPFTDDGLFERVRGKKNVAIVAFTMDGDVFGGFHSVAVMSQHSPNKDKKMFAFSLESRGRCATPKRFPVKTVRNNACVKFWRNDSDGWFVSFTVNSLGCFYLGNCSSRTWCRDLSFAFQGIEDTTLTGKNNEAFCCCRLVALTLS